MLSRLLQPNWALIGVLVSVPTGIALAQPFELQATIEEVGRTHPRVQADEYRLKEAQERIGAAWSAMLPSLSISAGLSSDVSTTEVTSRSLSTGVTSTTGLRGGGAFSTSGTTHSQTLSRSASINWTVFDSGATFFRAASAMANADSQEQAKLLTRQGLGLQAAQAYLSLSTSIDTEIFYAQFLIPKYKMLLESPKSSAADRVRLQAEIRQTADRQKSYAQIFSESKVLLEGLLGRPIDGGVRNAIALEDTYKIPETPDEAMIHARKSSPQVLQALARAKSATNTLGASIADMGPRIDLFATRSFTDLDSHSATSEDSMNSRGTTIGARLTIRLGPAQVFSSAAQNNARRAAEWDKVAVLRDIDTGIKRSYNTLKDVTDRYATQRDSLVKATEEFKQIETQLNTPGVPLDLSSALAVLRSLETARLQTWSAITQLLLERIRVRSAMGALFCDEDEARNSMSCPQSSGPGKTYQTQGWKATVSVPGPIRK